MLPSYEIGPAQTYAFQTLHLLTYPYMLANVKEACLALGDGEKSSKTLDHL